MVIRRLPVMHSLDEVDLDCLERRRNIYGREILGLASFLYTF